MTQVPGEPEIVEVEKPTKVPTPAEAEEWEGDRADGKAGYLSPGMVNEPDIVDPD